MLVVILTVLGFAFVPPFPEVNGFALLPPATYEYNLEYIKT